MDPTVPTPTWTHFSRQLSQLNALNSKLSSPILILCLEFTSEQFFLNQLQTLNQGGQTTACSHQTT